MMLMIYLIDLDHLVKVGSVSFFLPGFSTIGLITSPFVINKYLGEDSLRL